MLPSFFWQKILDRASNEFRATLFHAFTDNLHLEGHAV